MRPMNRATYPLPSLEKMFDEWKIHPCNLTMTNGRFRGFSSEKIVREGAAPEIKIFFLPAMRDL